MKALYPMYEQMINMTAQDGKERKYIFSTEQITSKVRWDMYSFIRMTKLSDNPLDVRLTEAAGMVSFSLNGRELIVKKKRAFIFAEEMEITITKYMKDDDNDTHEEIRL